MAECIYCGNRRPLSSEHYLPVCLGRFKNFDPLKDKLCIKCNSKIGLLEEQFCRCGPEAFFRILVGIKGRKHHKKASPFYRGSSGGKHIVTMAKHPALNCDIYCEMEVGTENTFPARQIIFQDQEGKHHPILIVESLKEPEDLKKALKDKGIESAKPIECWTVDPNEQGWIENLLTGFKVQFNWNESPSFKKTEKQLMVTTFQVTSRYFRAIAKIAFHYFLKHCHQFNGLEREFEPIKAFIINGLKKGEIVKEVKGAFVEDLKGKVATDKYCHLLALQKTHLEIRVKLQFFVGPHGAPPHHFEVFIGKNPERIFFPQSIGHQFVYYEKQDSDGFCGRMDPLRVFRRELLP